MVEKHYFGVWLRKQREQADWTRVELTERVPSSYAAIRKYEEGTRSPDITTVVHLLNTLRRAWGPNGSVAEALDGVLPLGFTWEDIHQAAETPLLSTERRAFLDWWQTGRPAHTRRFWQSALPKLYVERAAFTQIRKQLMRWTALQQVRYQGIVLWGPGGIGKTTLAQALGLDAQVQRFFRDGVLWLDAQEEQPADWAQQICATLGLEKNARPWSQVWQTWAQAPTRRCLVVLDDVTPEQNLAPLITGWGPQMVVLITTQTPHLIERQLMEHLPADTLWVREVSELVRSAVEALVEGVTQQEVEADELKLLEQVHRQWGWSPELVLQAAFNVQQSGWTELEGALQEGDATDKATLARRHLERIRTTERRWYSWLQALARIMDHRWPFGLEYGAAVWNISTAQASHRLTLLTQAGLLARLQDRTSVLGDADPLWQVWPWVYALLPDVPTADRWWQELPVRLAQARAGRRLLRRSRASLDLPWWLPLLGIPLMTLLWPLELGFLIWYKLQRAKRTWSLQRWKTCASIFLLAAMRVQEQAWQAQRGLSQEYWLLLALPVRTMVWTLSLTLGSSGLFLGFWAARGWTTSLIPPTVIAVGFDITYRLTMLSVVLGLALLTWEHAWIAWVASQTEVNALATRFFRWVRHVTSE
jgi:transcriptional regulator with XRE-family HTH domain